MPDRKWQIIPSKHGLAVNVCQHDNASHEWTFFFFFAMPCPTLKISTWEPFAQQLKGSISLDLKEPTETKNDNNNPRGKTGGPLTAGLLVAVVRAIVVVVTSPQGRDAASVLALKLPGFTL